MTLADVSRPLAAGGVPICSPDSPVPLHPLGDQAKVLLCSVFGPYARDDEHGSRSDNPMELWHNQVTRVQGPFSLRMFHRSWGLMLIQANLQARCTCLDFPDLDRFVAELRDNDYDVIGISAILPNLVKVRTMCELIRRHRPDAVIVVGGHISGFAELPDHIDADHIVRGDGVRWFRKYLGEDPEAPIQHPRIWSGLGRRTLGVDLPLKPATSAAALIPSVGCPVGCNFCATSAMFGGKGHFLEFYPTAEALYAVMCQLAETMKTRAFFVMDENFLLQRRRSLKLLELMRRDGQSWALYVFSSANALRRYSMEQLVALGVSWVWIGLEGEDAHYGKLNGTDTRQLVAELQEHGIRVQGSTIIGLEEHTPENIGRAIDYAVSHDADFHQFMLYTPVPGTPLHAQHQADGTLLSETEIPFADVHGQYRFNFRHPNIPAGDETDMLLRAFRTDYSVNGPSVIRALLTTVKGWKRYRRHPDRRIRRRFAWEMNGMRAILPGALWAAKRFFADNKPLAARLDGMLRQTCRDLGLAARLLAPVAGTYLLRKIRAEARRLADGWTQEPPTFYERNYVAPVAAAPATLIRSVPGLAAEPAPVAP